MNQKNPSIPKEAPQAAPAAEASVDNSLETLRKRVEINRKQNQALYTRVESWILGEGSKPGENKIDFSLWGNSATAEKDIKTIFQQFPEFKTLHDSITENDKNQQQNFIQLLGEKLGEKVAMRQEKKKELAEFSKKEGSEMVGDYIETGVKNITKWFNRGKPEDYLKIAATGVGLCLAYQGVMTIWEGIKGQMGPGRGLIRNLVVGGGLTAGVVYGLSKVFKPESAYAAENSKKIEITPNTDFEQKRINKIIETNGHAKAFHGLTNAPIEEVLDNYRRSENFGMQPKFLEKYPVGKDNPEKKWFKEMARQIKPNDLYQVTNATFKALENSHEYQEAAKKNPSLTLLDYIQQEYVDKARERNTTITFSEFANDVLRASQVEKPETAAEATKTEKESDEKKPATEKPKSTAEIKAPAIAPKQADSRPEKNIQSDLAMLD